MIGFLLCVYLYVFEIDKIYKIKDIFINLIFYVICYFKREIENDKSNSVKILFMFLLFYISFGSFKLKRVLDFKYGEEIWDYLENIKVVLENFVKEMELLNFGNLFIIVESLIFIILVKLFMMFEFKY